MTRDEIIKASKVPAVTLGFWIIKILATTLGETAGDTVSMTWKGNLVALWTRLLGSTPPLTPDNLGYELRQMF